MKAWKIVMGVVFIAVAVLLILEAVGVISPITGFLGEISFWQALGGIALVGAVITVLSWRQIWMIFVPLGFLFMIFEKNIAQVSGVGEDIINNWLVFGCSVLLSLGFLFIIPRRKKVKLRSCADHGAKVSTKGNKMGFATVYIDCDEFGKTETEKYIENKCGAIEIHFENPCSYLGGATLHLDSKLGAIEIHVPKEWKVNCDDVRLTFGALDWDKNGVDPDGPMLTIDGDVKLGAVEVNRV